MRKRLIKEFKENKGAILFVLTAFLAWRIWLQVFLSLGFFLLPLKETFLAIGLDHFVVHPGLWSWANFDGVRYLSIAHHGYGNMEQAFFPLFPWLIRILVYPFRQSPFALLISGLTISHLAFLTTLFLFYKLIKLDFDDKVARRAILFLLIFPTSFFFGAVYTESLFLVLIIGSFYAARKKNWWFAGVLGAFASATRVVGILLLPALLWEWWEQRSVVSSQRSVTRKNQSSIINHQSLITGHRSLFTALPLLLIPLGLLFYMRFLSSYFQDPLMFIHAQPAFGVQRSVDKLILLYQVIWRYLKMIVSTRWDPLYFTVWLELLTAVGFGSLLGYAYVRKIRFSYLIFAVFAYLVPTLTGTFCSMPRYVLILFPCFIALALIKNNYFRFLLIIVCCLLLAVATIFFTRGYWIG